MINAKAITDCLLQRFREDEIDVSGHSRTGYRVVVTSEQFQGMPDYTRRAIVRDLIEATFDDYELVMINLILTFTPPELDAYMRQPGIPLAHT